MGLVQTVQHLCVCSMTELEKDIISLSSGLKSIEAVNMSEEALKTCVRHIHMFDHGLCVYAHVQELQYQQAQSSQPVVDRFVPVVSQFIAVASFSFSDVEESLREAKELVSVSVPLHVFSPITAQQKDSGSTPGWFCRCGRVHVLPVCAWVLSSFHPPSKTSC